MRYYTLYIYHWVLHLILLLLFLLILFLLSNRFTLQNILLTVNEWTIWIAKKLLMKWTTLIMWIRHLLLLRYFPLIFNHFLYWLTLHPWLMIVIVLSSIKLVLLLLFRADLILGIMIIVSINRIMDGCVLKEVSF